MILDRASESNLDSLHEGQLSEFLVHEPFSGDHAENFEHGLTDTTIEFSEVKRAIIQSLQREFGGRQPMGELLARRWQKG